MLSHLLRTTLRRPALCRPFLQAPRRFYYPDGQLMTLAKGEYYADPKEVAERVVRLFALHDNVKDPSAVTLKASFAELGLNALDMVELFLGAEQEFSIEFIEEDCESMTTVNDLVENIARNEYTK